MSYKYWHRNIYFIWKTSYRITRYYLVYIRKGKQTVLRVILKPDFHFCLYILLCSVYSVSIYLYIICVIYEKTIFFLPRIICFLSSKRWVFKEGLRTFLIYIQRLDRNNVSFCMRISILIRWLPCELFWNNFWYFFLISIRN